MEWFKPTRSSKTSLFNFNPRKAKTSNLIFGFDIPKPARKVKGRMAMNWTQAKKKYPSLSPLGDADRDGVQNWLDCRPFDKKRQMVKVILSKEEKKRLREVGVNPRLKRIGYEENIGEFIEEDIDTGLDIKRIKAAEAKPKSKKQIEREKASWNAAKEADIKRIKAEELLKKLSDDEHSDYEEEEEIDETDEHKNEGWD
jgi:hypothetical protein